MKARVIVQCGIKINDEYWYVSGNVNGLFKKNLLTGEIGLIGFFPGEEKTQFRTYSDLKLVNNKIIFAPCFAKEIAVYDLSAKKFSNISFPAVEGHANKYLKSVEYNGYVYFIPYLASYFLKYNVHHNKIKVLSDWNDLRNKYIDQDMANLIIEEICVDNNYIFMFMCHKNKVIILDMEVDRFQIRDLNILPDERVCSVCEFKGNIWLVTNREKIYKWNYVSNEIIQVIDFSSYIDCQNYYTNYISVTNNYIYLINLFNKDINVFNYADNIFETINMDQYVNDKKDNDMSIYYYFDIKVTGDNTIQLFSFYDGKYITIEGTNVIDNCGVLFLPEKDLSIYFDGNIISENLFTRIGYSLLDGVRNSFMLNANIGDERDYGKNTGKIIHNNLMKIELK